MKTMIKPGQGRKILATAVAAAVLGFGAVGTAHAGAKAYGILSIQEFVIFNGAGAQYDAADFDSLSVNNTGQTIADLSSVGSDSDSVGPSNIPANPAMACVDTNAGATCTAIGQNNFAQQPPTDTFSRADALQTGAIITGTPAGSPAFADHVAETQIHGTSDSGTSTGSLGTSSGFSFSLSNDDTITFDFLADIFLEASVHAAVLSGFAGTSASFTINIHNDTTDTDVFSWTPNGTPGDEGDSLDPFDLTNAISATTPGTTNTYDPTGDGRGGATGHFIATTPTLLASDNYSLTIDSSNLSRASKVIPEPLTLTLMGLGLVGMGAARRRRA